MLAWTEIERLMQLGGWALIRYRAPNYSLKTRVSAARALPDPYTGYGYTPERLVNLRPTSAEITLMDETVRWLSFVPNAQVRRIVALRSLYDDDIGRCIHSYASIARAFRCTAPTIRKRHHQGLHTITAAVNRDDQILFKIGVYVRALNGQYVV